MRKDTPAQLVGVASGLLFAIMGTMFMSQSTPLGSGGITGVTGTGSNVVFSQPATFANGTAAAPSIAWESDRDGTGTGEFRQAANVWAISINGTETYRYTSTELRILNSAVLWNRTYRDLAGSQRLDFGASATNTYTSQAAASGTAHSFEAQTTITSGLVAQFCNGNGTGCLTKIDFAGTIGLDSTDSTGSPGAATINKPSGSSAIAVAANSVVITNSLVTTTANIQITNTSSNAGCLISPWVVTKAAGSFTVTASANCTVSAATFDWVVFKKS